VLEAARKEAVHLKDEYVSVEHLLMGILQVDCPPSDILKRYSVDATNFSQPCGISGHQRVTDQNPEGSTRR